VWCVVWCMCVWCVCWVCGVCMCVVCVCVLRVWCVCVVCVCVLGVCMCVVCCVVCGVCMFAVCVWCVYVCMCVSSAFHSILIPGTLVLDWIFRQAIYHSVRAGEIKVMLCKSILWIRQCRPIVFTQSSIVELCSEPRCSDFITPYVRYRK